jgi:hypothetical protein
MNANNMKVGEPSRQKKASKKLNIKKWKGHAKASFRALGYSSVDKFIEDIRGR